MEKIAAIKVRGVEEGAPCWIALHHTVVSLLFKRWGTETRLDIPVECLAITRKKRVNALWFMLLLFALLFGVVAGIGMALVAARVFAVDPEPNRFTVPVFITFLLPAVYLFFRVWQRDPVVEFSYGEGKHARFAFWLPLRQRRREAAEVLLASIEAARPQTTGMRDQPLAETDESSFPFRSVGRFVWLVVLFSILAISRERAWLFALALVPLLGPLRAGFQWLRTPKLLRKAVGLQRRRKWEEALACLERFEGERLDQKCSCLLARLELLRRLGRFDDAVALVDDHLSLIGPEAQRALQDDLRLAWRIRQRKESRPTGGWLLR